MDGDGGGGDGRGDEDVVVDPGPLMVVPEPLEEGELEQAASVRVMRVEHDRGARRHAAREP